jgi:hypothetical protein
MALAFLIVLAPHLWWLVSTDFQPFRYVDQRALAATRWIEFVWFPLRWTVSQVLFLAPALALLAIVIAGATPRLSSPRKDFSRRYVVALAVGPFAVTTLVAALLGRLPIAMWGYPLWCFLPLAVLMAFGSDFEIKHSRVFALAFALVFLALPAGYAAAELFEPFLRDRPKATQFPGRLLADTVTQMWRVRTQTPLAYVGGAKVGTGPGEFAANNVAVYSPDRPRVIVHGDLRLSPWIDPGDLERRGAVFVWEQATTADLPPDHLRLDFPRAEFGPPIMLPRQALNPVQPAIIGYALLPPRR